MKRIKKLLCVFVALLLIVSAMAIPASAKRVLIQNRDLYANVWYQFETTNSERVIKIWTVNHSNPPPLNGDLPREFRNGRVTNLSMEHNGYMQLTKHMTDVACPTIQVKFNPRDTTVTLKGKVSVAIGTSLTDVGGW